MCIAIVFLVFWSICLSSSLVHFKNDIEYLTSETTQVFITLMRFLLQSFEKLSRSFEMFCFYFFSFVSACLIVHVIFLSSHVLILSWYSSSIPSLVCLFSFFIWSITQFSMPNSIAVSWPYIFIVWIRFSNSFFYFVHIAWCWLCIIFSCDFVN